MSVSVSASSALTPLAPNFAGLKRYVANYIQGASDPGVLDVAGQAINAGVHVLNRRNWNWAIKSQTITLAASDDDYSLNADVKRPRKLWKLDSSSNRDGWIRYLEAKVFMDASTRQYGDGAPSIYTIMSPVQANLLLLNTTPSSDFVTSWPTLKLFYYPRIQLFADDNDTISDVNLWPEAWGVLGWYARYELVATRGLIGTPVTQAREMWRDGFRDLKADDNDIQTDWD